MSQQIAVWADLSMGTPLYARGGVQPCGHVINKDTIKVEIDFGGELLSVINHDAVAHWHWCINPAEKAAATERKPDWWNPTTKGYGCRE